MVLGAVCCGGRGAEADLYLTGEMSHVDILDATFQGINVILCEHNIKLKVITDKSKPTLFNWASITLPRLVLNAS